MTLITECGLGKSISLYAVLTVHVYGFGQPKPIGPLFIYQLFFTSEAPDLRNLGRTYPEVLVMKLTNTYIDCHLPSKGLRSGLTNNLI